MDGSAGSTKKAEAFCPSDEPPEDSSTFDDDFADVLALEADDDDDDNDAPVPEAEWDEGFDRFIF